MSTSAASSSEIRAASAGSPAVIGAHNPNEKDLRGEALVVQKILELFQAPIDGAGGYSILQIPEDDRRAWLGELGANLLGLTLEEAQEFAKQNCKDMTLAAKDISLKFDAYLSKRMGKDYIHSIGMCVIYDQNVRVLNQKIMEVARKHQAAAAAGVPPPTAEAKSGVEVLSD